MRVRAFLVRLIVLALVTMSANGVSAADRVSPGELLDGAPLGGVQDSPELVDDEDVLALSPEMLSFVNAAVLPTFAGPTRLQKLIDAIISEGTFGLVFDGKTRTASETFRLRRGNCLSFSNMFVAMARHSGLKATYQEVDLPPDWSLDNDVFILNRHVNVHLDLGVLGEHVVDFNIDDFWTSYDTRLISDTRALAHYFNNMGVERMQAGDTASALVYFRKAIADNDYRFSPAWTNLGTLYRRQGFLAYAEAAYLQALRADKDDSVAMSNLASLYEMQGDAERAAEYRRRVVKHRKRNPYYRYQRAREAYDAGDYDVAIGHLKYSVRKKKNEDQFFFLMSLCYLKKGDDRAARRWLSRAEKVAASDAQKRKYSSKLELLLSESESRSP